MVFVDHGDLQLRGFRAPRTTHDEPEEHAHQDRKRQHEEQADLVAKQQLEIFEGHQENAFQRKLPG